MEHQVAVSMRSAKGTAREMMQEVVTCGARFIQLDAFHPDFDGLSASGRRDITATIRRCGLHASGVDFLIPLSTWEVEPDKTLQAFAKAVEIAEVVGNVPVGTLLPDEGEIMMSALAVGYRAGVLVSTHGIAPPKEPQVGWHLPVTLLSKVDRPMKVLAQSPIGPMAVRLKGEVVGDSTIEIDDRRVELRELRGVLDAMRWNPTPIIDALGEEAVKLMKAWQVAGPW